MNASRIIGILLLCFLSTAGLYSQNKRSQLEKEKKENLAKIKEAERILRQTTSQRKSSLGQLQALTQQIRSQESLIQVYRANIELLNGEIKESNNMIKSLEADLALLKEEYANMVYQAEKSQNSYGSLSFLFSSSSFSELVMRTKYLKQYTTSREHQAQQITEVQHELREELVEIESHKKEQVKLLSHQQAQNQQLRNAKVEKDHLVKQLSLKEKDLRQDLKRRKQAIQKLDRLIAEVIRKEMESTKKADGKYGLTPEGALLSSNFQGNQKRLSWPVAKGFVSSKFGLQPHPVLKGVKVENPGVDIQTQKNELVRAVFEGEVSKIASVPGMNGMVIIIQHGEYRTVYANLSRALVKTGDKVKAKDPIGEVFTDANGVSEVQFQVWKSFNKLDPLAWLQPK